MTTTIISPNERFRLSDIMPFLPSSKIEFKFLDDPTIYNGAVYFDGRVIAFVQDFIRGATIAEAKKMFPEFMFTYVIGTLKDAEIRFPNIWYISFLTETEKRLSTRKVIENIVKRKVN